ncbi:restriction endonuclease subunit S [Enterococcus casseliflavus]|uniref:restriction endonuclease subunit S n=1 Tax=Enterococcus casseliflavus TaxID=37734 RepID=UPI00115CBE25|nr:restriction endonuclease subunit S [Enterococcus casseliflavus]
MKLKEIFEKPLSGEWGTESPRMEECVPVIRTTNFRNTGKINYDNLVYRKIDIEKKKEKLLKNGDIIIEKSGGSPAQPVGRVVYFDLIKSEAIFTNNFTAILRPKKNIVSKYAFYFLRYLYSQNIVLKFQNKTTGIINLKLNDYLEKIEIQIPSLLVQQKIADILDLSSELIEKRKDQIAEMDKLVQSMFEEVLSKEKCSTVNFDELIVSSKNGLSRRAQDEDGDVVLKIPNIQPNSLDLRKLNKIRLTEQERDKYSLSLEDLLIVRVNGNPNYVGRNAVFLEEYPYYFNDHIIRIRVKGINVKYLSYYLNSRYGKSQIAKNIKTSAGQYTISRPGLDKVKIRIVSKHTQERFVSFCSEILLQKKVMEESLHEMENNFNALMHKAFRGELFPEE